jgi:hypothetical protein
MATPRKLHPLDRWTEDERGRVLAGNTLRRGRPSDSFDPFILSGLVLLCVLVVGVPVMAWLMGRELVRWFWR